MTMEPAVLEDVTIRRGATWRRQLTFTDTDVEPPELMDFTGCEARMEVRPRAGSETLFCSISEVPTDDGSITVLPEGVLRLHLTPTATLKLAGRKAALDVFLEWPSGDVDKVLMAGVTIDLNVTEPTHD